MDKKTIAILIFSYEKEIKNIDNLKIIGSKYFSFIKDDFKLLKKFVENNNLSSFEFFLQSVNQGFPLMKYEENDYRIEPGAIIRDQVSLGHKCVILMNSTINVGAKIGDNTMIDMNVVVGSSAVIGNNCHIGAGAVIAGIMEPNNKKNVIIEDNVFIGANSVVLEGITIGHHSIIGAMCLVNKDIPPYSLVMGVPCKIVKKVDKRLLEKCKIEMNLR